MAEPDLRAITEEVARRPEAWATHRSAVRAEFDAAAARYERRLGADHLAPLAAALEQVEPPRRALDVGCGTGVATDLLRRAFPSTHVCGIDLSAQMLAVAVAKPRDRAVHFVNADASATPFRDSSFDLVVSVAVPLFAAEAARVLGLRGTAVVTFPLGAATPIYLPPEEVERVLGFVGMVVVEHGSAGRGTFSLARKA